MRFKTTYPGRRAATRTSVALSLFWAGAASAQTGVDAYQAFLDELRGPATEYVALGLHFRHDDDCTARGCILMGPTVDREACEEWVRAYNQIDPYDVAQCFEASSVLDR